MLVYVVRKASGPLVLVPGAIEKICSPLVTKAFGLVPMVSVPVPAGVIMNVPLTDVPSERNGAVSVTNVSS